jgi:hypothetical protein
MITDEELIYIILDLLNHIKKYDHEPDFKNWFAGITYNPTKKELLYKNHIYFNFFKSWDLRNKETAKSLKKHLIERGFKKTKPELILKPTFLQRLMDESSYLYVYKKN